MFCVPPSLSFRSHLFFFVPLRIKFVGVNPLILAVCRTSPVKVVEYLLSRKVPVIERDTRRGCVAPFPSSSQPNQQYSRWNIYHYVCEKGNLDLLELFLEKLPRETSEMLLAQQSNGRLNTVSCLPCLLIHVC